MTALKKKRDDQEKATMKADFQAKRAEMKKEALAKYDTNKDGKLDKKERAKISKEDQEKLEKAGLGQKHEHASKETN